MQEVGLGGHFPSMPLQNVLDKREAKGILNTQATVAVSFVMGLRPHSRQAARCTFPERRQGILRPACMDARHDD